MLERLLNTRKILIIMILLQVLSLVARWYLMTDPDWSRLYPQLFYAFGVGLLVFLLSNVMTGKIHGFHRRLFKAVWETHSRYPHANPTKRIGKQRVSVKGEHKGWGL